jgi:hypothetical protein
MHAVGADYWEDMRGKLVRVASRGPLIIAVGHILDDVWFTCAGNEARVVNFAEIERIKP